MGNRYLDIAFTDNVKAVQEEQGSRVAYARHEGGEDFGHKLTDREIDFIGRRDSFYMASVNADGWPYIQHRGGPTGFLRVLDDRTLGFADFRGNRQYVTVGNVRGEDRVSLFLMDYPNRRRLKLFGRVEINSDPGTVDRLKDPEYRGHVERGMLIRVEGFDWNCPQHITQRFSEAEIREMIDD